jgi:hypothetical protein
MPILHTNICGLGKIPRFVFHASKFPVEHIFLHYVELDEIRNELFNVSTLAEIFRDINPKVILQFVPETGLYRLF